MFPRTFPGNLSMTHASGATQSAHVDVLLADDRIVVENIKFEDQSVPYGLIVYKASGSLVGSWVCGPRYGGVECDYNVERGLIQGKWWGESSWDDFKIELDE